MVKDSGKTEKQAKPGGLAIRIVGWDEYYEVTDKGHQYWSAKKRAEEAGKEAPKKRPGPLPYVRFRASGLDHTEDYRKLLEAAGPKTASRCFGLWGKLLEIAASKKANQRGWILS